jgi:hypothetical protein
MGLVIGLAAVAVVVLLLVLTVVYKSIYRGPYNSAAGRQRMRMLAEELHAQARMDALTRQTAQAMRDAVRPSNRRYGG